MYPLGQQLSPEKYLPPHWVHGPTVHMASGTVSGSWYTSGSKTSAGSFSGTHCEKSRLRTIQLAPDGQHLLPSYPLPPHGPQSSVLRWGPGDATSACELWG